MQRGVESGSKGGRVRVNGGSSQEQREAEPILRFRDFEILGFGHLVNQESIPIWKPFGSPSGLEMALAGIGNEMDRSIAFGMHLKAILPPLGSHWAPFGLRVSLIGPHLGHT